MKATALTYIAILICFFDKKRNKLNSLQKVKLRVFKKLYHLRNHNDKAQGAIKDEADEVKFNF